MCCFFCDRCLQKFLWKESEGLEGTLKSPFIWDDRPKSCNEWDDRPHFSRKLRATTLFGLASIRMFLLLHRNKLLTLSTIGFLGLYHAAFCTPSCAQKPWNEASATPRGQCEFRTTSYFTSDLLQMLSHHFTAPNLTTLSSETKAKQATLHMWCPQSALVLQPCEFEPKWEPQLSKRVQPSLWWLL